MDLVLAALDNAYACKKPAEGLVHHSDRGAQYASEVYRARLQQYGMEASMSRKGNCYDNACIESFHSLLKKEMIYCTRFKTKVQAEQEIFEYIEIFYNRKRIHGSLGYVSPARFETMYYQNSANLHEEVSTFLTEVQESINGEANGANGQTRQMGKRGKWAEKKAAPLIWR